MGLTAAETYRQAWEARQEQGARLRKGQYNDEFWSRRAPAFTLDPNRPLDRNHQAVADLIEPGDVLVDVGGGGGRVSLPLASRCAEVINVEPAEGMCRAFEASAQGAGITNARAIQAAWTEEHGVCGDVCMVFNVTYFVRDIVPFVEKLVAASRRRVIISVWSVPPPDRTAPLHEIALGEPLAPVPGHRELLPALWEMGILPDVRVLPNDFKWVGQIASTRSAALQSWIQSLEVRDEDGAIARRLGQHFDDFFSHEEGVGVVPAFLAKSREMLITWEV